MTNTLFSLGLILLIGLLAGKLVHRIKLPSVTAYLLLGILIGPSLLNLVSDSILGASGLISNLVLGFIAFSLGQNFSLEGFKKIGKTVLWISIFEATGAWILVTLAVFFLFRVPLYVALLFGAIASATAPAATVMVVREYKARGSFTDTLLGVVAIDDAWCLIIFAISLAIAKTVESADLMTNALFIKTVSGALLHIFGAFLLGGFMSWMLSLFSIYARTRQEFLIYTLGFIFLNTGLATYFGLSLLLANMFLGAVLVNVNRVSFKFFDTVRSVDSPLYLLFFILVGANLEIGRLATLGLLGAIYVLMRSAGKIGGAYLGGLISKAGQRFRKYIGLGLLPQAGVALGVALAAKATFPQWGGMILNTIIATTIVYELIGPVCTRFALDKAGEI